MPTRVELERDLYLSLLNLSQLAEPDDALRAAMELALKTLKAEQAYLEVYPPFDDVDPMVIHSGMNEEDLEAARRSVSHGIIADAVAAGRVVHTPAAYLDDRYSERESVQRSKIEAVVCAPIGSEPAVVGVLYLSGSSTESAFQDEDLELLGLVAHHMVPVIRRLLEASSDSADATTRWRKELRVTDFVGKSKAVGQVLKQVFHLAEFNVGVLITGESGTGKSLLAKLIHQNSDRRLGPFVHLNCANFSDELLESELFGAVKGGHSMAIQDRPGKLDAAKGGTLFLDEISELSASAQAKLLVLLEDGTFYPVGSPTARKADVRIITATNAELGERVDRRAFRADLLHRINGFAIRMPRLSERRRDIRLLAKYFATRFCHTQGLPEMRLSASSLFFLEFHDFPGNVRELQKAVERACIRARGERASEIAPVHFGDPDAPPPNDPLSYEQATRQFQRNHIKQILTETDWNVSVAHRRLKLSRSYLYTLIARFGLSRKEA